ncbi:MAG: hypothetical protein ACI4QX_00445 [Lachnospiraceae bacterium]
MNEQEKEINLKRLLYKACKNWRVAAAVAIIGAVVVGGTRCAVELVKVSDPEVISERQTEYLGELALYQQKGEVIRRGIEDIENSIVQQEDYNENSVLMKIDPYNEWKGSIDFYVETDWKIMPELSYQDQNLANQIVRVYDTYISNGELYQYILERLDETMEIRYLREVLSGSADSANYLIHFTVCGVSKEECQKLLTLIEEGMRAKQADIATSVGEHKLLTTNSSTFSQINYTLEQTQKNNLQAISDLNTSLAAKKFEQLEWERDEKEIKEPVIDKPRAVKTGIKMAVLTGVVLVFVTVLFYGIGYLLSKLVQDRDEFDGWDVYVAELPRSYKKRAFRWVDHLVGRWFLGNVKAGEYDTRLSAAAKQIGEAAKLAYGTAEPKLALVGDLPKDEMEALADAMQKTKSVTGVRFAVAGNPLLQTEAIESVLTSDAVVLVAKQEYTKRESLYQMKAQVQELKKPLAAVVLTNVDAMV